MNAIGTTEIDDAPAVAELHARALEGRAVVRGFVHSAGVVELGRDHVLLRTSDRVTTRSTNWSGVAAFEPDEPGPGALRIDLVADDVVRVRYRPTAVDVADPTTPMVVGKLDPPAAPAVERCGEAVELETQTMTVRVALKPVEVTVTDRSGREVCRLGGREKNAWAQWDGYNNGLSHTVHGRYPVATECFALRPGEAVYGFGERFCRLDKVGQTLDLNMVAVREGQQWITIEAPIDKIPLWIRDGGVVALGPRLSHVDEQVTNAVTLRTFAPTEGRTTEGLFDVNGPLVAWRWNGGKLSVGLTDAKVEIEMLR